MRYLVIRNTKTDKLTLHSSKCSVVAKHYAKVPSAAAYQNCDAMLVDTRVMWCQDARH